MKLSKKESCVYGIYNNSNKLLYVGANIVKFLILQTFLIFF